MNPPTVPPVRGSVLVMRGESVVVETHSGLADVDTVCSARTRFQIASVSKQFTAAAILLLAERGALSLTDPVTRWIGDGPSLWRDITPHHLLTHTSGLGHWRDYPMIDLIGPAEPADLLATFGAVPPLSAPGDRWHYSSPGYVLLAHVAQRTADEPYRDLLAGSIFSPLGLDSTFAGSPGDRPDVARGYVGDRPVPSFELDVVGMGAGDVWSTAGDMVAWLDRLRAGHLLSAGSLDLMVRPHAATTSAPTTGTVHYGYGWFIGPLAGEAAIYHSGENDGFRAFDGWFPTSDRRLVVLTNDEHTDPAMVTNLLAATTAV